MPVNLPGPYEIEFLLSGWISPTRTHKFRLNVATVGTPAIGTAPTAVTIQKAGGGSATLAVVANQAWEFMRLWWPSSISCTGYQLWRYVSGTYAKTFISTGTVTNPAANGTAFGVAHEVVLSFRSANGGVMKQVFLESNQAGNNKIAATPNPAGTPAQKWVSYIMSADNVALARDDAYPLNPLFDSRGENERLFRLIFRGT